MMCKVTVADVALRLLTPVQESPIVALRRRLRLNLYARRLWHSELGVPLGARLLVAPAEPARRRGLKPERHPPHGPLSTSRGGGCMTTPDDDTDVYGWTQAQAALIRARAWEALDVEHVAEEIEDLCKTDAHHLTMLVLGCIELIDRPCAHEQGQYDWPSAVIDHHRAMLAYSLEESPRVRAMLARELPEAYRWARERVMRRRTPPQTEPPAACPWPLAGRLDERWWPPEAPARLP